MTVALPQAIVRDLEQEFAPAKLTSLSPSLSEAAKRELGNAGTSIRDSDEPVAHRLFQQGGNPATPGRVRTFHVVSTIIMYQNVSRSCPVTAFDTCKQHHQAGSKKIYMTLCFTVMQTSYSTSTNDDMSELAHCDTKHVVALCCMQMRYNLPLIMALNAAFRVQRQS